jgi:hypothetical protein
VLRCALLRLLLQLLATSGWVRQVFSQYIWFNAHIKLDLTLLFCAVSAGCAAAAAGNKRLGEAGDELVGQKDHFREAHGSLGTLKRQAMIDRCGICG